MNQWYEPMFNPQYVNQNYFQQQQAQHNNAQPQDVTKAVNAFRDFLNAARKVEPQYRQTAFSECIAVLLAEMQKQC